MSFKAVIFDFDGVLLDSEVVNIEAGARGFAEFGYELTQDDRAQIVGRSSLDYIEIFQEKYRFDDELSGLIREKISEEYDSLFDNLIKLQPYVKEVLEFLRSRHITIGIATTNRQKRVETFFRKYNLASYFAFSVAQEDLTKRKPDPEVYLIAKSRTPLEGGEILAIEDTGIGVLSAKAAGLKCVAIPTSYTKNHDFSKADYVFDSLKEVEKLFS